MIPFLLRLALFLGVLVVARHLVKKALSGVSHATDSEDGDRTNAGDNSTAEPDWSASSTDPWELFSLSPSASFEEVEKRYRELLAQYHPDKVDHLGEEFQQLAHEKSIAIREAYERIVREQTN